MHLIPRPLLLAACVTLLAACGGDNVKHGDLSSALKAPTRELDVHMGVDGLNFACTACAMIVVFLCLWACRQENI